MKSTPWGQPYALPSSGQSEEARLEHIYHAFEKLNKPIESERHVICRGLAMVFMQGEIAYAGGGMAHLRELDQALYLRNYAGIVQTVMIQPSIAYLPCLPTAVQLSAVLVKLRAGEYRIFSSHIEQFWDDAALDHAQGVLRHADGTFTVFDANYGYRIGVQHNEVLFLIMKAMLEFIAHRGNK